MKDWIGDIGHLLVIVSFVTSVLAAVAFYKSRENDHWYSYAKSLFALHAISIFGVVVSLFLIILNHYYQYHYAWSHSSNDLPVYYMISCFWEGQEGSFLLWLFWHALLGALLLRKKTEWTPSVLAVFMVVQVFLSSMILGVVFGDLKIGSSPFSLLSDVFPEILTDNIPTPAEGTGLNPLLQNYWMVIHPPTLFMGFALTLVPFAYAVVGLWDRKYSEWIKPALPWTLIGGLILGVGILMGGYWAYETLNFGGYWNWDPVENAVYVPWLILVAGIHTMILFKRSKAALKTTLILVPTCFLLILYSTFLTRSGILGESSVHSFTDLGLSGQLLIYLLFFVVLYTWLVISRWKQIKGGENEVKSYTREFWIFAGTIVFGLMSFQVLVGTSIPVFNSIAGLFGAEMNLAPPEDPIKFYSSFQIWGGLLITFLGASAQFIWWNKVDATNFGKQIARAFFVIGPILVVATGIVIYLHNSHHLFTQANLVITERENLGMGTWGIRFKLMLQLLAYILVITFAVFSMITSAVILVKFVKKNISLSGGAIAHIGVAMIMIGILFSAGYDKVVSLNISGKKMTNDEEFNKNNLLLLANSPAFMGKYSLTYLGRRLETQDHGLLLDIDDVKPTFDDRFKIANVAISDGDEVIIAEGDSVKVHAENIYYEVEYKDLESGETFYLHPRVQHNSQMGSVASPDIKRLLTKDLYTHVTMAVSDEALEWENEKRHVIPQGGDLIVNDFVGRLDSVKRDMVVANYDLAEDDLAVTAFVSFYSKADTIQLTPTIIFLASGQGKTTVETSVDLGVQLMFEHIDPDKGLFTFKSRTRQRDYIVMKAVEKPLVNMLWIGTLVTVLGFSIASLRRYKDYRKTQLS